jgi:hypothetical protein
MFRALYSEGLQGENMPNAKSLTLDQLRAVGEMQFSAGAATREIKRIHRIALAYDINITGINLEQLQRVYSELNALVLEHLRTIPDTPRKHQALSTFHTGRVAA